MFQTRIWMIHVSVRADWPKLIASTYAAHFHGRISAVLLARVDSIERVGVPSHVLRQKCGLIKVTSLVSSLIS